MSERDLSYIAGIIDGEGCISICSTNPSKETQTPSHWCLINVTNTDYRLISYLQSYFKAGSISTRKSKGNRKEAYSWVVNGSNAMRVAEELLPYLLLKKEQAELLIELQKHKNLKKYRKTPADVLNYRRDLESRIRLLNYRGVETSGVSDDGSEHGSKA